MITDPKTVEQFLVAREALHKAYCELQQAFDFVSEGEERWNVLERAMSDEWMGVKQHLDYLDSEVR